MHVKGFHHWRVFRGRAGYNSGTSWRALFCAAIFAVMASTACLLVGLLLLPIILNVSAALMMFTAGYCFRQEVLNRGRPPSFRWLLLKEDDEETSPPH